MSRIKRKDALKMNVSIRFLIVVVIGLKTPFEANRFFRDLLTEKEINDIAKRLVIANLLDNGVPFSYIRKTVTNSNETIFRVNKWLNRGYGGLKNVLRKRKDSSMMQ